MLCFGCLFLLSLAAADPVEVIMLAKREVTNETAGDLTDSQPQLDRCRRAVASQIAGSWLDPPSPSVVPVSAQGD